MGVTIHYTMIAEGLDAVVEALRIAVDEAVKAGYEARRWVLEGKVAYSALRLSAEHHSPDKVREYLRRRWGGFREERLVMVPEEPPWPWMVVEGREYVYATPSLYSGKLAEKLGGRPTHVDGVVVYCETAESFNLLFYRIGSHYICDGSTKTQAFTADEAEPNKRYHRWICWVLERLGRLRWLHFYVHDESGYYGTWDESRILEAFGLSARIIYAFSAELDRELERLGLRIEVGGGRVDVRRLRKRLGEAAGEEGQTILDECLGGDG